MSWSIFTKLNICLILSPLYHLFFSNRFTFKLKFVVFLKHCLSLKIYKIKKKLYGFEVRLILLFLLSPILIIFYLWIFMISKHHPFYWASFVPSLYNCLLASNKGYWRSPGTFFIRNIALCSITTIFVLKLRI